MKIQIKDLEELEALAKQPFAEHTTVISASLGDYIGKLDGLEHQPEHLLDVNIEWFLSDDENDPKLYYDPAQAEEIAEFVKKHLDDTDILICQGFPYCDDEFVVAVAAAVEDYLLHDDGKLFLKNGCFHGYDDVYKMLKDALAGNPIEYGALIEKDDDFDVLLKVEEVDTDEIVRGKSRD